MREIWIISEVLSSGRAPVIAAKSARRCPRCGGTRFSGELTYCAEPRGAGCPRFTAKR
jgi:hypothetical protein